MNCDIIISLVYYVGIASCAAQGAEKGKDNKNIPIFRYIANAFGGGFIRDIIFLKIYPWLFTSSAIPELIFVISIGLLYTYYFIIFEAEKKQYDIALKLITIADAIGLGSFISIGMDKAFVYSDNFFIIIACGYITAIGGGILATGKLWIEIFKSKKIICYHIIVLLGCYFYYIFQYPLLLIYFIVTGLFIANNDYSILFYCFRYKFIYSYVKVFMMYPINYNKNISYQRNMNIIVMKKNSAPISKKIYIVQHRIKQC